MQSNRGRHSTHSIVALSSAGGNAIIRLKTKQIAILTLVKGVDGGLRGGEREYDAAFQPDTSPLFASTPLPRRGVVVAVHSGHAAERRLCFVW